MNEQKRAALERVIRALAAPQQEPVQEPQAFLHWYDNAHWGNEDFKEGCHRSWNAAIEHTTPPAQPAAWVGLTDEQAKQLLKNSDLLEMFENMGWYSAPLKAFNENGLELIRAIEAKLRQKNGGKV